ncbi:MAG TPA: MFS transporter [Stellaceae bacterium]|nr:MFS transporter [Stellaceae bacterium]
MADIAADVGVTRQQVVARIERLPYSSWHTKMRWIICTAWFFDAFDSLAIAAVLPPLIGMWHLAPQQIGSLIGIGFAGQLVGSIAAGWAAERWGRVPTILVTLLVFTVMSFACALATNYDTMWWFRFVQGIGLGGEVPIMAAYVNEFARAERRGLFSLSIQVQFAIGLTIVALVGVWVVPHLGWQWMFVIGGVPALLVIPMRTTLPESPRWLASKSRFDEADRNLRALEDLATREGRALPPLPRDLPAVREVKVRLGDLFKGIYLRRTLTVWVLWICTYIITYGLTAWAPSLFRTVYKLPVEQSLMYGFILSAAGLVGAFAAIGLIDSIGRKPMYLIGLGFTALPLLVFWGLGAVSAGTVLLLICLSFPFTSLLALSLATYTAENYPTQLRALGGGVASAWQRAASMVGPLLVGVILPTWGLNAVFGVFGAFAALGCVVCALFAIETRGQVLETLSPPL